MDTPQLFARFGVALAIGLLVGLQRERTSGQLAGIRTIPLVTLLGATCGLLSATWGGVILAAGAASLAAIIVIGNVTKLKVGSADPGITSEVALLLMFAVGACAALGHVVLAIALGGTSAVLLQFKVAMHGFAARLDDADMRAIMQFALLALVVLPLLPDQTFGPYDVLNPRSIWWMVVLIVGLSLLGYLLSKFLGQNAGILLGGIFGGLISSTATTVSQARRTRTAPGHVSAAALVILVASAVLYVRLVLLVAIAAPRLLAAAAPPLGILLGVLALVACVEWLRNREAFRREPVSSPTPSEMRAALVFGALYAIILFAVAAVRERFGDRGLYVVAGVSGLTDVDAITLSTSKLAGTDRLAAATAWRVIVLATLSNLVFKAGAVAVLGEPGLRRRVFVAFGVTIVAGLALCLVWPD